MKKREQIYTFLIDFTKEKGYQPTVREIAHAVKLKSSTSVYRHLEMLEKDFVASGYKIIEKGGYWLKPLSNNQIAENWNISMINAFFELGKKYPKIAAEIYLISAKE